MKPEKIDAASNIFEFERLVKDVRAKEIDLAWRLYCIRETKSWEGRYSTFSDFLDSNHIRRDSATRMCRVIEEYVVGKGIDTNKLQGISVQWLYAAVPLLSIKTPTQVLAAAKTNTLEELKETIREVKEPNHKHSPKDEIRYAWCKCGKLMKV